VQRKINVNKKENAHKVKLHFAGIKFFLAKERKRRLVGKTNLLFFCC